MHVNRRTATSSLVAAACSLPLWPRLRAQEPAAAADQRSSKGAAGTPIRVGQIGVAHAHASKLSVYRQSPDYEVVGIVEPDAELRQAAQRQPAFRDVPWMTEEQLFNTPGLQAVLVETHVRDGLATAQRCIAAGKHIHLDKPAGASLPAYQQLLAAAQAQQLMVQMGYMYRYSPAVERLRQFLQAGWLGDIFEVHAVMSKVVDPASRKGLAEFSGGMMFELGCHLIDLVVGVLGAPAQVTAFSQHAAKVDDGLQDNMLAVFDYPRAIASVKTSALEFDGFARRHLVVCGTHGTFHIQPLDNPAAVITLAKAQGDYSAGRQNVSFPKFVRYVADAADMARVIRGQSPVQFDYAHDLAVQTAVLQAAGMPLT